MPELYHQESFATNIGKSNQTIVVEFFNPICAHCKQIEQILQKSEEVFPQVQFGAIDITQDLSIALRYDVTSVPTILFFKDGEVKERFVGLTHELVIETNIKKII